MMEAAIKKREEDDDEKKKKEPVPDLMEMKICGEMMVACNPCNQVFMPYEACPKCGAKLEKEEEEKPTPCDYKKLMMNTEPVMADWEKEVAKIGEDRRMAVEERAKHVKIEVEIKSETVINLFVKPLEGPTFQIKAYKQSNVKNLTDDIEAYLHENLQNGGDTGDANIHKHGKLFVDNRLKIQHNGKTLQDDTMYDFESDDTITIISVLSGEGSIRFVSFHFKLIHLFRLL